MEPNGNIAIKPEGIEDAKVISETKNEPKPLEQNIQSENGTKGTIQVEVETGKKKVHDKVTIDFMAEDNLKSHIKKETNFVRPEQEKPAQTIEQVREQIKKEEEEASKKFTQKDFEDIAGFLINLIDTAVSTGLRFWSKDTSDSAYALAEPKKRMLSHQLALILIKYNTKFSIEFMFLCTIVVAYAVPFQKAFARRRMLKEKDNAPSQPEKKVVRMEVVKNGDVVNAEPIRQTRYEKKEPIPIVRHEPIVTKEDLKPKIDDLPFEVEENVVVTAVEVEEEMTEDEKRISSMRKFKRGRGRPKK